MSDPDTSHDSRQAPDYFFRAIVTTLLLVACWLLAMPWTPAIARTTMKRFHLQTDSFPAWAIQQPIPPMYSFANTVEVKTSPPSNSGLDGSAETLASRTINHFPTRMFTFANARVRYLTDRTNKWFVLRSTYRGQTIESVYRLEPAQSSGWNATLESEAVR